MTGNDVLALADAAKGLTLLAERIQAAIAAGEDIPPMSACWPLAFRAETGGMARLEEVARSLGVEDGMLSLDIEEDGSPWLRVRGHVGGVPVEVTAGDEPVLDGAA